LLEFFFFFEKKYPLCSQLIVSKLTTKKINRSRQE
jgi:hypothetical protein